jgi:hypothetical protein
MAAICRSLPVAEDILGAPPVELRELGAAAADAGDLRA